MFKNFGYKFNLQSNVTSLPGKNVKKNNICVNKDHLLDEKEGLEHQANESKATITRLESLEVEIKR